MKKIAISKRVIAWCILFLVLLRPSGLVYILGVERISRMICLVLSVYAFLLCITRKTLSVPIKWYIAFNLWLIVSTIFNGTSEDINECFIVSVCNIGIASFVYYILYKDLRKGLKAVYIAYSALLIANFVYMLLFPSGYNLSEWYQYGRGYYLFGHQNTTITYVLPAICVSLIAHNKRIIKKWQMLITIALAVGSIVKVFSATSLVGLAVFFAVLFLLQNGKMGKYLKAKWAIVMGTGACIGIVFFNIQTKGIIADIIVNVLHRTTNFTSRTVIWEKTLAVIQNNFFLGIGYKVNTTLQSIIHGSSAHNEYLYMLLQGGIVLLALFYTFFALSKAPLEKNNKTYISHILTALYFSLFIQFLTETHMHRIAPLLALIGCAGKLIDDEIDKSLSETTGRYDLKTGRR